VHLNRRGRVRTVKCVLQLHVGRVTFAKLPKELHVRLLVLGVVVQLILAEEGGLSKVVL
jgi:hypothetical protein